jgi:hypothetical protein
VKARVLVAASAVAASACAAPARPHPAMPPPAARATPEEPAAITRDDDRVATTNDLAARGVAELPLMREVLRAADVAGKPATVKATEADTCFRAIVGASGPYRAWFEDDDRSARGEQGSGALVPPRGPACARRGETLRLVVASDAPSLVARAVVFQSP